MTGTSDQPGRALLLTPPGVAAIAVIRFIGPATRKLIESHFSRALQSGRAVHGELRDDQNHEIDDPLVYLSPDESFADINLHGGAWVVRAVLELARHAGFEIDEKLSIPLPDAALDSKEMIQREIDAYLPLATTELAIRTLLAQSAAWESLLKIAGDDTNPQTVALIDQTLSDRSLHWLLHPPRVAIIGAPNAGKSTLANQLFAQERSITADLPGTTRDWVGELANLDGLPIHLVDTPGIRETADPIERESIARSAGQIQIADLIVLVLDASTPLEPEQSPLIGQYENAVRVINKIDQASTWNRDRIAAIPTIATAGQGIDELRTVIREHFGCEQIEPNRARCWTDRQRDYLRKRRGTIS